MKKVIKHKQQKSNNSYVLLGIVFGTLSLAGLGYWYFKGRKGVNVEEPEKDLFQNLNNDAPNNQTTPTLTQTVSTGFPIKYGSRGALVKQLQEVMIQKYGAMILPKYGADGYYGKELQQALKSKGFSETIDMDSFRKIVSGTNDNPVEEIVNNNLDYNSIAKTIWTACLIQQARPIITELKKLKTTNDYKSVSDIFKTMRLRGVRQTLVNGVLSSLNDEASKQLVRQEFLRIGLSYNGTQWSLSGVLFGKQLFTNQTTIISNEKGIELEVPANTLLGIETKQYNGKSYFKTIDNDLLNVSSQHINYV